MHICVCFRLSEIPDDPSEVNCKVSGNFVVEDWCAGFECLFRVRHDIQRLIIDLNEVKCIIPNGKLLRHHDDNPLTGKAYLVVSEDGTPYHLHTWYDPVGHNTFHLLLQVSTSVDCHHTGERSGLLDIDAFDKGMCIRRAENCYGEHVTRTDIINVLSMASNELEVFLASD